MRPVVALYSGVSDRQIQDDPQAAFREQLARDHLNAIIVRRNPTAVFIRRKATDNPACTYHCPADGQP